MATANKVGRPEKWTKERCEALLALMHETGRTRKALLAERHVLEITVAKAFKRHGLSIRPPRKTTEKLVA
jgi:hypothetical protein